LLFLANGVINLDWALYDGYLALEQQMGDNSYVKQGKIPTVLGLEFQSPKNLIPPYPNDVAGNPAQHGSNADPTSIFGSNNNNNKRGSGNTIGSVSYWTIGGCVATVMGGLVSILVWSKIRHDLRQSHHMHLLDDVSLSDGEQPMP
jgi:hypothetical protein